jgi:hypothetical protein
LAAVFHTLQSSGKDLHALPVSVGEKAARFVVKHGHITGKSRAPGKGRTSLSAPSDLQGELRPTIEIFEGV